VRLDPQRARHAQCDRRLHEHRLGRDHELPEHRRGHRCPGEARLRGHRCGSGLRLRAAERGPLQQSAHGALRLADGVLMRPAMEHDERRPGMKRLHNLLAVVLILTLGTGVADAATPRGLRHAARLGARSIDATTHIDVNNISMFVTNTGSFAYDKGNQVAGLEFPKNTAKTAVYAAGLWIGAKVGGKV